VAGITTGNLSANGEPWWDCSTAHPACNSWPQRFNWSGRDQKVLWNRPVTVQENLQFSCGKKLWRRRSLPNVLKASTPSSIYSQISINAPKWLCNNDVLAREALTKSENHIGTTRRRWQPRQQNIALWARQKKGHADARKQNKARREPRKKDMCIARRVLSPPCDLNGNAGQINTNNSLVATEQMEEKVLQLEAQGNVRWTWDRRLKFASLGS